ncbi:MAG: sulfatase [Bacteroidaceae bacterium]|nr:sulfatase [Bacteroidaceae bacterium]
MRNTAIIPVITGVTALATLSGCADKAKQEKKEAPMNILYIMCDDHSYQTISAYDQRFIQTPNINRIAADGVRFTNSFVANSLSGPSRACMLTGKHSHANGFTDNTVTFDGSQQTFPKLLQQAGYETAMIGKWHLVSQPTGFDYWDILIGQGMYYNPEFICNGEKVQREGYATEITTDLALDWLANKHDKSKPFCLLLHHKAPHRTWMPDSCDMELFSGVEFPLPDTFWDDYDGRPAAAAQEMHILQDMDLVYDLKLADKEKEIHSGGLEDWGRTMYSTLLTPHQKATWDSHYDSVIEAFKDSFLRNEPSGQETIMSKANGGMSADAKRLAQWKFNQYMRDYLRVITSIDRNVGRVLDYLEANNLMDNTLIVYTSDQGFYMGEHGWFDKRFMYEESFRTPLLMHLPGGKKGDISQLVQNIDYAPTFLELAGVPVPDDIQGESLLPLLKGHQPKHWRKALYYHYYEYPAEHAVRRHYGVRDKRYKLIHFYPATHDGIKENKQQALADSIDCWELYDLKNDPEELHNIYGTAGSRRITNRLQKMLHELQLQYDAPELKYPDKETNP